MNSECFLTKSLTLLSSMNSKLSLFKCKIIFVPLVNYSGLSKSSDTAKVPPAVDSHLCYLASVFDLEMTVTLSATR